MEKEIELIKKELWSSLDIFRNIGSDSNSYHIILFLLILKREASLPQINLRLSTDYKLELQAKVNATKSPELSECFDKVYEPLMKNVGNITLYLVISNLRSIDIEKTDAFPEIFDWLLFRIIDASIGKSAGESFLPESLSAFMSRLVDIPENAIVFNPFAGLASFEINLKEGITYVGQEIDNLTWSMGVLRRIAHQKKNGYYLREDSYNEWVENSKFDLIISAPPFGKIRKFNDSIDSSIKSGDQYVVKKGIDSLKPNGKLVVLVGESFLFSYGAYLQLRKKLIEENLIETIISLPAGIFQPYSGVKSSILVLDKNKEQGETINLVDGSHFAIKEIKKVSLNNEQVLKALSNVGESDGVINITNEEVIKQNYNLQVSRYFWKEEEPKSEERGAYFTLSEILSELKGKKTTGYSDIKLVSIAHLSKDNLDYNLNIEEVEPIKESAKNARIINHSCLMVAKIGNDLKPTFFNFQDQEIAVSNHVMTFQVSEDKVDIDYLINELYSDFVLKQFEVFRRGIVQQSISKADFLQIKIPLPALQEQKDRMKGVKEAFIKSRLLEVELQKELLGYKDEAFREFASIKHTFRQYLNALKSNVSGTRKFISRNEGKPISLELIYSKNLNRTLGEHIDSLEGTIDSLSNLLQESEDNLVEFTPEILNPNELIVESQNRFKNPDKFKFEELYIDHATFIADEGYLSPFIKISKEAFYRIFSNIVSNAIDHGFEHIGNNIIRTSLSFEEEGRFCVIKISNNGKAIPEAFTYTHLVTRGEKTSESKGAGTGGADIKSLMEKHQGNFVLESAPDEEFPVTYILKFPIYTWLDILNL